MKKPRIYFIPLLLAILALITGCGHDGAADSSAQQPTVEASVDVDLTALSSTMVYSEVYNIMSDPESYLGKTIKMHGSFASYHDDNNGNDYYACVIQDAAACCAQGIEFVLTDGASYPTEGEEITVVGVLDSYLEDQITYYTLRDSKLL